jgi:hypothetical protein
VYSNHGTRSLAADQSTPAIIAAPSWGAGGGTILMPRNFNKCKTIHTESSAYLSVFQSSGILPHRNISCRSSETGQVFRTMNTVCTTSSSDQVKIATLLFLTLFYTEPPAHSSLPNGNKLTIPDFVRRFSQAK